MSAVKFVSIEGSFVSNPYGPPPQQPYGPPSGPQPQQPYGPPSGPQPQQAYGQPGYGAPQPYGQPGYGSAPPNNNMVWGIVAIFLCWPFAIPSLIKATSVQGLWSQGQYQQAEHNAAEAKKWGKIGVIVGACLYALSIVIVIISVIAAAGAVSTVEYSSY